MLEPGVVFHTDDKTPLFSAAAGLRAWEYAVALQKKNANEGDQRNGYTVLDPFCGNGTILYTIILRSKDRIQRVIGSDINPNAVNTSLNNMNMATSHCSTVLHWKIHPRDHMEPLSNGNIRDDIRCALVQTFNKRHCIPEYEIHCHDITEPLRDKRGSLLHEKNVDIVITDPPYEHSSHWRTKATNSNGNKIQDLWHRFFIAVKYHLAPDGVLAIILPTENCNDRTGKNLFSAAQAYAYHGYHALKDFYADGQRFVHLFQHSAKMNKH